MAVNTSKTTIPSEEQVLFLISCIRYSNFGKINFKAVAEERGIVTDQAAAKRYSRMMKAAGINPQAMTNLAASPKKSPPTPRKKRKTVSDDDEDELSDHSTAKCETKMEDIKSKTEN